MSFDPSRLLQIAAEIRAAASRDGKARGDHMAACQMQIASHFRAHWKDDEQAQQIADVASAMDHAIRAETAMVDALTAAGLQAADALEWIARSHNTSNDQIPDGPGCRREKGRGGFVRRAIISGQFDGGEVVRGWMGEAAE